MYVKNPSVANKATHINFKNSCLDSCFSLEMDNFYTGLLHLILSLGTASVSFTFFLLTAPVFVYKSYCILRDNAEMLINTWKVKSNFPSLASLFSIVWFDAVI